MAEQVRNIYDRDHLRWGCDSRIPLLAYLLRVRPSEGEAILRRGLHERKRNGCFRSMLSDVSRLFSSPQLEAVAIDALDDGDPEVATDAAWTLSRCGSAARNDTCGERWNAGQYGGVIAPPIYMATPYRKA